MPTTANTARAHVSFDSCAGCDQFTAIRWRRLAYGTLETDIGGTVGYRSIIVTGYPFWNENGTQCLQRRERKPDDT